MHANEANKRKWNQTDEQCKNAAGNLLKRQKILNSKALQCEILRIITKQIKQTARFNWRNKWTKSWNLLYMNMPCMLIFSVCISCVNNKMAPFASPKYFYSDSHSNWLCANVNFFPFLFSVTFTFSIHHLLTLFWQNIWTLSCHPQEVQFYKVSSKKLPKYIVCVCIFGRQKRAFFL